MLWLGGLLPPEELDAAEEDVLLGAPLLSSQSSAPPCSVPFALWYLSSGFCGGLGGCWVDGTSSGRRHSSELGSGLLAQPPSRHCWLDRE